VKQKPPPLSTKKKKFDHQKSIFVVEKQSSYSCASQFRWEDDGILPIKGF
jgi:hypothetical protein